MVYYVKIMANKILNQAKEAKNDEFYTQMPDIENELRHYRAQFKGSRPHHPLEPGRSHKPGQLSDALP